MTERVKHPRAVALVRGALYLFAAFVAASLALTAVAAVGAVVVVGAAALLTTGEVNLLAVGGLSGLIVLVAALAVGALAIGVRRVERAVRRADAAPDPLDELKREYVDDRIDEGELERRLGGVLDDGADSRPVDGRTPLRRAGDSGRDPIVEEESVT